MHVFLRYRNDAHDWVKCARKHSMLVHDVIGDQFFKKVHYFKRSRRISIHSSSAISNAQYIHSIL